MAQRLRILFCSPHGLTAALGAPKVLVELAEELEKFDWEIHWLSPGDLGMGDTRHGNRKAYIAKLSAFLSKHAGDFDVVEYDHETLPLRREIFPARPLMVARSVILAHQVLAHPSPRVSPLRALVGDIVRGRQHRRYKNDLFHTAEVTLRQADLINVSNDDDRTLLLAQHYPSDRIVVLPYGISSRRRPLFDAVPVEPPPGPPTIGFVGTFDYRKGAKEFPSIANQIIQAVPNSRFILLGVKGTFTTEQQIRSMFAPPVRDSLEIHLAFQPDELPRLLSKCSAGIFPSYVEGFGFGVLEMLASAMPVIAYDAPGPPMMLPPQWLVTAGDVRAMAGGIVDLLKRPAALSTARARAREISHRFNWTNIARDTDAAYRQAIEAHSKKC